MAFTPSPPLAVATTKVLTAFAMHRPQVGAFKIFRAGGADSVALVSHWARALLGVSLEVFEEAAERWIATRDDIPVPATFAKFARKIDDDEYRTRDRLDVVRMAPSVAANAHATRRAELDRRVREHLPAVADMMRLWDVLLSGATTDDERAALRDGHVSDVVLAKAIRTVLAERQSKVQPISQTRTAGAA